MDWNQATLLLWSRRGASLVLEARQGFEAQGAKSEPQLRMFK